MSLPSLSDLASRARALLPGAGNSPVTPGSYRDVAVPGQLTGFTGGPPFWLWVAALCTILVGAATGVCLGSKDCVTFFTCGAATVCVGAITVISGLGLGYRAHGERVAARVAIAAQQTPQSGGQS